ncbi:MAG TPA: D-aminoacyl-tRNA deacylase [Atribacteraceae bacterium]|nr:D-aminoacyl-tRNA deacylase [Atribacteraceae bacterium]
MIAVIQRVTSALVRVGGNITGKIDDGLLVFLGVGRGDDLLDVEYLIRKIPNLRLFKDKQDKMNASLIDRGGKILLVSQFTLYGECRRGLRPSFDRAADPILARELFEAVRNGLAQRGLDVQTGIFGAIMQVELVNDGPVTILLESKKGNET